MASVLEKMKKATDAFVQGYNTWDLDDILAPRSDDCVQQLLPKSMGRAPRNNAEYKAYAASVRGNFTDFKYIVDNAVWDADARKCALHAHSEATTVIGPFRNEYAVFLWFDEPGSQITRMEEFLDTAYSQKFFADMLAHQRATEGEGLDAAAAASQETTFTKK